MNSYERIDRKMKSIPSPTLEQWLKQRDEDDAKTMRNMLLKILAFGFIGILAIATLFTLALMV